MQVFVFVETERGGVVKRPSLEALCYGRARARALGTKAVYAVAFEHPQEAAHLGRYGASEVCVLPLPEEALLGMQVEALASALPAEGDFELIMARSLQAEPLAAHLSVCRNAVVAMGVTALPEDHADGCLVARGIYTGKAFEQVQLCAARRVLCLAKNAVAFEQTETAAVPVRELPLPQADAAAGGVRRLGRSRSEQAVPLPDAEVVVSGGRGLKGPEHWHLLEALAATLGAATACSKPVSDMGWRPHHEHVGQTGIKVAPKLYIAVGISGAVQHLAGVNNSKTILVINKDPEAPFFQVANYGMVGDALEILPRLTAAFQKRTT